MRPQLTRIATVTDRPWIGGSGSACSSPADSKTPPSEAIAPSAAEGPVRTTGSIEHVHNLALVDDDTLLIGTHDGIWQQQSAGAEIAQVGESFDVMGFAAATDRWLASGHPSPGTNQPADLGLLESTDAGKPREPIGLEGQVDFHRITVSEDTVLGVNSGDGLLWGSDVGGKSWQTLSAGPFDVALDPEDSSRAVATTDKIVGLVAWTETALYGVDEQGRVYRSTDGANSWEEQGRVDGQPGAVAANGDRVAILAGGTVWFSDDAGATFTPRVEGIGE